MSAKSNNRKRPPRIRWQLWRKRSWMRTKPYSRTRKRTCSAVPSQSVFPSGKRPSISSSYLSQSQNIVFQQLEIDYVIGDSQKELLLQSSGQVAIIRIFCVTREGHSVCCHVHGYKSYFYISCPAGMCPDDISRFHQALEGRMREANRNTKVQRRRKYHVLSRTEFSALS